MTGLPRNVSDATRASLAHVLTAYGVEWGHVIHHTKTRRMIAPRRAVYWLLHCRGFSTVQIGHLCRRDHTSIVYALKKVNQWKR